MSFDGYKKIIQKGDTVVLYLTINQIYSIKVEPVTLNRKGSTIENVFQTPYGALKCGDLIGKYYGTKISLSKGWGYVLQPNPELWTLTLPHRTQIIYTPDISMIILQLEISPGSVVIESGTGSGSLSHALLRRIKPKGHLYTFDFHETRVNTVREEFQHHGLENYVSVEQRDVCADGFGSNLDGMADAVFLDLPHPWLAIPHAMKSLKNNGGRLCSFSPCVEQVLKTYITLQQNSFQGIQTVEVIQNQYSIQAKNLNVFNFDFLKNKKEDALDKEKKDRETIRNVVSSLPNNFAGHTGFLTFATLPPYFLRNFSIQV